MGRLGAAPRQVPVGWRRRSEAQAPPRQPHSCCWLPSPHLSCVLHSPAPTWRVDRPAPRTAACESLDALQLGEACLR